MMRRGAGIAIGLVLWLSFCQVAAAQTAWACEGTPVEPCAKRHGRLSSQNGIALKIWLIGTRRMVAVTNTSMPSIVEKYLEITSDDHSYIFGDFEICFLEPDVPGHIRLACVRGAENLVVQPLRRQEPAFRLRSTWTVGLDQRIGLANRNLFHSVRDAKDWANPYLVIRHDGIEVISKGLPSGSRTVAASDLKRLLIDLPVSAWPYGRVVVVQDISIRAGVGSDEQRVGDNRNMSLAILEALRLVVERWPRA